MDVVTPVASEADCQNCHVEPLDCVNPDLPLRIQNDACLGAATSGFQVITLDDAPPGMTTEQQLLNTAKINILRLHDVRHGSEYPAGANGWGDGGGCNAADNPNDVTLWNANCLANSTPVQCSQCHYSPAVDLAQLGPTDNPASQVFQATVNHSMSSVMHGHHGELEFESAPLFPAMPSPAGRSAATAESVLGQTCYQCHPGKRTRCLRGAMFSGGVVCQDCHGQMADVGLDFTTGGSRVPWASEPKCQSCHTGDAVNPDHPAGAIVAGDGIRLLQAYTTDPNAPIQRPNSRFAENESLFRLSGNETTALSTQGHQGIMCEGCHGSTHAVWPNANPFANDNVAAKQLQGHSGTLIECDTCHTGNLGNTLGGPHGLHPVGNTGFAGGGHDGLAEGNLNACAVCHGAQGQGTVLSRAAVARTISWTHDGNTHSEQIAAGDYVGCDLCHGNPFTGGGGDD